MHAALQVLHNADSEQSEYNVMTAVLHIQIQRFGACTTLTEHVNMRLFFPVNHAFATLSGFLSCG